MRQIEVNKHEVFEGPNLVGREDTLAAHLRAVERVITVARGQLCEPISLHDMSRVAYLSEFHFHRVFHQITGLPPAKFISAMRLEEAKRLLLNTNASITDICFDVGYNSLSTFTRRFTQRVGLGPREFRYLAERITPASVESLCAHYADLTGHTIHPAVEGLVDSPKSVEGPIFVGLFRAYIPQSRPVGGALLTTPGAFHIGPVPDGTYHLLAAALPRLADTLGYLLPGSANLLVGAAQETVIVRDGRASGQYNILLRPMALTDPPLLVSLPFLLYQSVESADKRA
ncbi:MAG TPA: helix-turn-helix transcriptional regulator [Pyrinomonadaceae bacterium]|nr:helix-turn-helix transcriptional regulator [Pyrinomonadaceae bacterium]